ncbi:hypothetical protein JTB14_021841 [Gonioctena quinquepunctata]|nr:hypothetical protein JTB14_021841 [Gonioctena quinquepunctata]
MHLMDNLYSNYTKKDDAVVVDALQRNLECCGRANFNDPAVQNGSNLIDSCCKSDIHPCTTANSFTKGCYHETTEWIRSSVKGIGIVAIIFAAVELMSALFACYVKSTRRD